MPPLPPIALRRLPQGLAGPARRTFVSSGTRHNVQPSTTPPAGKAPLSGKGRPPGTARSAGKSPKTSTMPRRIPRVPQTGTDEIEQDGKMVTLRMFQHPKSPSDGEHLTTLATAYDAKCYIHYDEMTLARYDERPLRLPYYYLRDLCKCPQCVDPHSKQRSFRTHDIHPTIHPRSVKWDGNHLEIQWHKDIPGYGPEHTSRWPYHYLRNPIHNTHDTTHPYTRPFRWNAATMEKYQYWIKFDDWVYGETKFTYAMQNLARLGLIFIKDIPPSRDMLEKIATRMGPLRNSFYGSTWDVRTVPEAKNVAYTNQHLGFHMDLLYMNEPPGYQLLHCLENSCEGGESLFADTFNIADRMKRTHPTDYYELTRRHLGYEYVHQDSIYHNTWPVFELDPKTKELKDVNYSPPFQSAVPTWKGEGGKQNRLNYEKFWKAMYRFTKDMESEDSVFKLKLNPGECVIFANRRVVHARNKFSTENGSRWLAGAYVDQDALLSRFAVTREDDLENWVKSDPKIINHLMPGAYQTSQKGE